MLIYPMFEIWGYDAEDVDNTPARFREDCFSLEEAVNARAEWQLNGRAAWIIDKETGAIVKAVAHRRRA
jgi:hypothetical protein